MEALALSTHVHSKASVAHPSPVPWRNGAEHEGGQVPTEVSRMYLYIHMHTYIFYIYSYSYQYIYIYIYVYNYIYIYTYICIYKYI